MSDTGTDATLRAIHRAVSHLSVTKQLAVLRKAFRNTLQKLHDHETPSAPIGESKNE